MRRYAYLAAGILWVASLAGVGWWQNAAGHTAERVEWQDRENKELREANAKIVALTEAERRKDGDHAQALVDISTAYQKDLAHEKDKRARDVAAARAGTLVLRYDTAGLEADRCSRPAPGTGPGGRDGAASGQLPPAVAADLLGLVDDADDVARQLAAAQQVIVEDRRRCSGSPP